MILSAVADWSLAIRWWFVIIRCLLAIHSTSFRRHFSRLLRWKWWYNIYMLFLVNVACNASLLLLTHSYCLLLFPNEPTTKLMISLECQSTCVSTLSRGLYLRTLSRPLWLRCLILTSQGHKTMMTKQCSSLIRVISGLTNCRFLLQSFCSIQMLAVLWERFSSSATFPTRLLCLKVTRLLLSS